MTHVVDQLIDEDLVIPDKSKSVYDGAIAPWRGEKMNEWLIKLIKSALKFEELFYLHLRLLKMKVVRQEKYKGIIL